jgi:hypothetical protein
MCQNENDGFQAIWPSTCFAEWDPPKFADYKTSGATAESLFCSHPHPAMQGWIRPDTAIEAWLARWVSALRE